MTARDPLNFFSPYERLPAGHENQLTRALLLLLRMCPLAHVEWLRLVAPELSLAKLPPADFKTQKRTIRAKKSGLESANLISVFLAPERPQASSADVVESDRGQVLDAIVDYGGELITVIENKVFEADDLQASQINLSGSGVQLAGNLKVTVVLWRDLLEALISMRERGLVGGAEAAVLDDFLTYVEDHFPELGPFRTLALCHGSPSRMERRLRQILGEAAGADADRTPTGPRVATPASTVAGRDAYLSLKDEDQAELAMYPADTLSQARAFYARQSAVDGVRRLDATEGWEVLPNFHFGHMERGFCWTTSEISMGDYLDLWQAEISAARIVPKDEWSEYWKWLFESKIASQKDLPEFESNFTATARSSATPRPGLYLRRRWPLDDAEQLDSRGAFAGEVRAALNEALGAVGESGLPA